MIQTGCTELWIVLVSVERAVGVRTCSQLCGGFGQVLQSRGESGVCLSHMMTTVL